MNKEIKQLPKEINKIIDFYIPYKELISIPLDHFLFHFLNITGVYILYSHKAILYIGCSGNIGTRLITHSSNGNYGKKIKNIDVIRFLPNDDFMGVEARLIDEFKPIYNKVNQYSNPSIPGFDINKIKEEIKKELEIK